jgi:hypothetical protein
MANTASKPMMQNARLNIVRTTGSSKIYKQHAVGWECINIAVNSGQLIVYRWAGVSWDLHDDLIATRNGKHPWFWQEYVHTVVEIELYDIISSWILAEEVPNEWRREWTKQALITL